MAYSEAPLTHFLNLLADIFSGAGAGILAYRGYLGSKAELRLRVSDVAVRAARRTVGDVDSYAQALGVVEVFDFDEARSAMRQRVDAWLGILMVILGAALPLASLAIRRGTVVIEVVVAGIGAGFVFAWLLTEVFRYVWRRTKEDAWLAHAWLAWLERQIPNPLAPTVNVSQDLMHIVLASRHSELQRFLDERWAGEKYHPLTIEDREAIERWVAVFAIRRKHRFESEEWREWVLRKRTPARSGEHQRP